PAAAPTAHTTAEPASPLAVRAAAGPVGEGSPASEGPTGSADSYGALGYVIDAIRAGRDASVPALVARLSPARRRDLAGELPGLRRELREAGWTDWQRRGRMRNALLLAGAGCHTGAAAAAAWLASPVLRDWDGLPTARLLAVLADRDPAWLGDLAHRLAARAGTARDDYPLIRALVRVAGCPVPTGDAFVHGWAADMVVVRPADRRGRVLRLGAALRADPDAPALVARLFETVEPAAALTSYGDPEHSGHWPAVLAALAAEGVLDRSALVEGAVARLVRGGRPQHLRVFSAVLRRLELDAEEERRHTADWTVLAADAPSTVAGDAQQVLARLWAAGDLSAARLADVSEAVLFRPEKKLVRAQLVLLGKALRRDAEARHVLLPAAAAAFGHQDTALQERALALVVRHLRPGDTALREELRPSVEQLGPAQQTAAAALLGVALPDAAAGEPYREVLPAAPAARPQPPAPATAAETVELVAALVRGREPVAAEFEAALDGLVRHAHGDRAALAAALEQVLATGWQWEADEHGRVSVERLDGLELVAAAVLGRVRPADLATGPAAGRRRGHRGCVHQTLEEVLRARVHEVAHRVLTAPLPFLLATPSVRTGSVEAADLVARLDAYGRLGTEPAPNDFAQALLRVRRDPAAAPAAAALGSSAGDRLAAWLTASGDAADRLVRRVEEPAPPDAARPWNHAREGIRRLVVGVRAWLVPQREFPAAFHDLGRPATGTADRCWHWAGQDGLHRSVLPEDREVLAAWALPDVTGCAASDEAGGCAALPALAELGGEAGPVLHLAVATGLGARHAEDRLAAVDALLVLAARGELAADRIGGDLAELLALGTVKPNRLADAAGTAAATGAHATTWAVLAHALPSLLAAAGGPVPPGAGDLLAVAADCVERCGAAGPYPQGLDAAADRTGSSRYVAQARRLRTALTGTPAR
ncbi:DUF6493 family protein, partial [Streptomyces solincola]|uniref:DUF6493 family protein n=1 Tax=Streptomyces solincola TaxID=2100817 RepID=UPI002AFFA5D4